MLGRYCCFKFRHRTGHCSSVLKFCSIIGTKNTIANLCKYLNIKESQAHFICLKHPVVNKLNKSKIKTLVDTLNQLGYSQNALIEEPVAFSMLPITLKYRHTVLNECGMDNITISRLVTYLNCVKRKTIGMLKNSGDIPTYINVENRLATYLTQWPTSLTSLIHGDVNELTLQAVRLKILQRYLELVLDLTDIEFSRAIETYPNIKQRPLQVINEVLTMLQTQIMMPNYKIKNNMYLIHVDPDNLKQILLNVRSIGGIDIKEIIRCHPRIATRNCYTLLEMQQVLQNFGISDEAQRRCHEIYTLGPSTVRDRLKNALSTPEFQTFVNHPRFLKMIYHNTTAMRRIKSLYDNNKKCVSLSILSGSNTRYELFKEAPGDRMGKGSDLIFCISQSLENLYSKRNIRNVIKQHPFWINIPLVQIKFVYRALIAKKYSSSDIYNSLPILLYPWDKIRSTLDMMNRQEHDSLHEHLDYSKISNAQKLSLALYLLEKNHYFSGNGVWTEEKYKASKETEQKIDVNSIRQIQ